jgi:hypothetical protein
MVAPELPRDLHYLRTVIEATAARLVVIDVLMAYLSDEVNTRQDHDLRRALRPLARLAEELAVAIIVLRHLTKGGGANPIYRGGGAIGLGGAARSVLLAGPDPKVPGRHLLARVKGNLAAEYPTLAYEIRADDRGRPFLRWHGPSSTSALEILAAAEEAARDAIADRSAEEAFLEEVLADGEQPVETVTAEGERRGLKYRAIWRASTKLGVKRRREGFGPDSRVLWSLPSTVSIDSTVSGYGNTEAGEVLAGGIPW